jgi:hypothetical protein
MRRHSPAVGALPVTTVAACRRAVGGGAPITDSANDSDIETVHRSARQQVIT